MAKSPPPSKAGEGTAGACLFGNFSFSPCHARDARSAGRALSLRRAAERRIRGALLPLRGSAANAVVLTCRSFPLAQSDPLRRSPRLAAGLQTRSATQPSGTLRYLSCRPASETQSLKPNRLLLFSLLLFCAAWREIQISWLHPGSFSSGQQATQKSKASFSRAVLPSP